MPLTGDSWTLRRLDTGVETPAHVPGCVHLDLIAAGQIEDPFYRDNESRLMWIGETDWAYQRDFDVSAAMLARDHLLLRCHGLDTLATVRINGVEIATADNMFRTWVWDVKPHLRPGTNTLDITFAAPVPFLHRMDAERGEMRGWVRPMRIHSAGWLRKEPSNFGWDWGPVLVTSGIWRDLELIAFDSARLSEVAIAQTHHEEGAVSLTVSGRLDRSGDAPLSATVQITLDGQDAAPAQQITIDEDTFTAQITIATPQLWWINGLGGQPLYTVTVTLQQEDIVIDQTTKRIGLRVFKLERHEDTWGESFAFSINGVPFFAKGANWIPADVFPSRLTRADYARLLGDAHTVHMNMIRVWGGGIYESDDFYDVCDELGLAVWQDFIFACGTYPGFDADFRANVKAEAEDNVRRLRHHASLALWCGNNEIEQGMAGIDAPWKLSMTWADYALLFDELLPSVVSTLDPETAYWPGSPHSPHGDREDHMNPKWGDTHLWAVWHGKQPFEWYHTRLDRFVSEFGFQSFPQPTTVARFTVPEDRNITSYVMEHHQRSAIGNATIIEYLLSWFQLPTSFDMMLWMSQILQAMAMKYAVEGWRRNMPRTMGALYWQLNDLWGAPTWSGLDYLGNWKALQYLAARFFAPVLISGVEDSSTGTVAVHVTSDATTPIEGIARWQVTTTRGETVASGEQVVTAAPQSSAVVLTLECSAWIAQHGERSLLVWLEWVTSAGVESDNLVTFARPKHLDLAPPKITVTVADHPSPASTYMLEVVSGTPALFVWLELADVDQDGVTARFSDNFFHLAPGQTVAVEVSGIAPLAADVLRQQLRVYSLVDSFA